MTNINTDDETNSLERNRCPTIAQSMVNITTIVGTEPNMNISPKVTKKWYLTEVILLF